jgi:cytochrome c553
MNKGSKTVFATRISKGLAVVVVALIATGPVQAAGNAESGKTQAAPCAACHGQDGATGLDATYPNLAGQNEKYLLRQLRMIQAGTREIPLMAGQLNGKSEQELADLAAYFSSLPSKLAQAEGDDASITMAASLYRGGNLQKNVAACAACHSPAGVGNAPAGFPLLSGQSAQYTIAQLTAYREGVRKTDEDYGGMMRDVAANLNDTEIKALADYLRGVH